MREELRAAFTGLDVQALQFECELEGLADGPIVVDDKHEGPHAAL
jgi:hypothetical protein